MNWGMKIILAYVFFAAIVATMVTIAMKQDVSLVAADYYKQEIAYQDQIDRMENVRALEHAPKIRFQAESNSLTIAFPKQEKMHKANGNIHLFRPSNVRLDREFALQLDEQGKQSLAVPGLAKGLWRVKLQWEAEGKEYYHEKLLVL